MLLYNFSVWFNLPQLSFCHQQHLISGVDYCSCTVSPTASPPGMIYHSCCCVTYSISSWGRLPLLSLWHQQLFLLI